MTCRVAGSGAVTQASTAARAFGEAQWLAEDEIARLCIIVEELVANLYDHGGLAPADEAILSLQSEPGGIRMALEDRGTPFDPRQCPPRPANPERGGGAGVDIVRAWALITDYQVTDQGNRLELLLPVAS